MSDTIFSCENKYAELITQLDEAIKSQRRAIKEQKEFNGEDPDSVEVDPFNQGWLDAFIDGANLARQRQKEHTCANHTEQLLTLEDLQKHVMGFVKERLDYETLAASVLSESDYTAGRIAAWDDWVFDVENGTYDPESDMLTFDVDAALDHLTAHSRTVVTGDGTAESVQEFERFLQERSRVKNLEAARKLREETVEQKRPRKEHKPSMWYSLWMLIKG